MKKIIIAIIVAVLVLSLLGVYYLVKKEYVEEESPETTIKSSKAEDLINQINIGDTYEKLCSTLGVIGVEDRRMSSLWYIFEFEDKSAIHVLFTRPRINSEINEFIVSDYRIENN